MQPSLTQKPQRGAKRKAKREITGRRGFDEKPRPQISAAEQRRFVFHAKICHKPQITGTACSLRFMRLSLTRTAFFLYLVALAVIPLCARAATTTWTNRATITIPFGNGSGS